MNARPSAAVDLFLGLAGDDLAAFELGQRVLVQRPPAGERALAQLDVVAFRPREVEQRRAELGGCDHADVDLRPAARDDAGLRGAAAQERVDRRQRHHRVHHALRIARRHQDVDVTDRLREAAQRATRRRVRHAGHLGQARDDLPRQRQGHRDRRAPDRPLLFEARQRLGQLLLGLLAEPLQVAQLVLGEHAAQVVDRGDTQLGAQPLDGLRAEALDAQQRHHGGRVLRREGPPASRPCRSRSARGSSRPCSSRRRRSFAAPRRTASPGRIPWALIDCAALSYARTRNEFGSPSSRTVSSASSCSMSSTSCFSSATGLFYLGQGQPAQVPLESQCGR